MKKFKLYNHYEVKILTDDLVNYKNTSNVSHT